MVDKPRSNPNRIPANETAEWQSWAVPTVDGGAKGDTKTKAEEARLGAQAGETIEDVEIEGLTASGLTAEQMSEIVQAAEQEGFAHGLEKGQQQGYEDGYRQGQERGGEDIRQLLTMEQQTFASLVQALKEPIDEQDEKLEALMLTMIERISRAVVGRDLVTQPVDILPLVRQSIAALPSPGNNVTLHLNLADHDCVKRYAEEHGHDWTLRVAPEISAGGVRVSTNDSLVDFTVERRLDETLERFKLRQDLDETTSDEQLLARELPGVSSEQDALNTETPELGADTVPAPQDSDGGADPSV
ncbi:flagellar assembly protein FliH [Gilvimarinus agarilyticus]|uniref:flagellar assembly protein FliH n=1 Tax=Gilvimarinus agarilyticus TaxID=679259 RepID=UPI0005A01153|nr:flagellar assembly protein FliH [Gilvimarinus agarilyticus]